MTQPQPSNQPEKRKPLGEPIDWSDEDLDHLAAVTPADLSAARALWNNEAPAPLKQLLDADVDKKDKKP